jgi:hypothetical protein
MRMSVSKRQINSTIVPLEDDVFRQPPSPQLDDAWRRLIRDDPVILTREDVVNSGLDVESTVKWPESMGFGKDVFVGHLEVAHLIHCLNSVRKEAYSDHYFKDLPERKADERYQMHLSHCVHVLLQNLICHASTRANSPVWLDVRDEVWLNFNREHKCRSFEDILEWHDKNSVDKSLIFMLKKPPGAKARVTSRRFREAFGYPFEANMTGGEVA